VNRSKKYCFSSNAIRTIYLTPEIVSENYFPKNHAGSPFLVVLYADLVFCLDEDVDDVLCGQRHLAVLLLLVQLTQDQVRILSPAQVRNLRLS